MFKNVQIQSITDPSCTLSNETDEDIKKERVFYYQDKPKLPPVPNYSSICKSEYTIQSRSLQCRQQQNKFNG